MTLLVPKSKAISLSSLEAQLWLTLYIAVAGNTKDPGEHDAVQNPGEEMAADGATLLLIVIFFIQDMSSLP